MKRNYKKVLFIILLMIITISLQSCSTPDENDIKSDLQSYYKSSTYYNSYDVESLTIDKMQVEDSKKAAHYWAEIIMTNDKDRYQSEIEFIYDYYDKGGWKLRGIEDTNNYTHTPLVGCDENDVITAFENDHNVSNVKVDSRETELEVLVDTFYLSYSVEGINFDCDYSAVVEYTYNNTGEWRLSSEDIYNDDVDFHPTGIYGEVYEVEAVYSQYRYFEFTGYDENAFNLTYHEYVDVKMDEDEDESSFHGKSEYCALHYTLPIETNENGEFIFSFTSNDVDSTEETYIIYSDYIKKDSKGDVTYLADCNKKGWNYIQSFDKSKMKNGKYNGKGFYYTDYYSSDYKGKMPDNVIKMPNVSDKNELEAKKALESLGFNNVDYSSRDWDEDWSLSNVERVSSNTCTTRKYINEGDYLTPGSDIYLMDF